MDESRGKERYRSYFQEHKTQVKDAIKEIKGF
jgi:hypothetical protein